MTGTASETTHAAYPFAPRGTTAEIEGGEALSPKFDADGLLTAVVTDAGTGVVLMLAHMDVQALRLTLETGTAHFFSRSRARLWKKGEESGNTLTVLEMRVDCDQDAIWLRVRVEGGGVACHTGARSCFYRRIARSEGGERVGLLERAPIAHALGG